MTVVLLAILAALLFFVPLLRIALSPLANFLGRKIGFVAKILAALARYEYLVYPLRKFLCYLAVIVLVVWMLVKRQVDPQLFALVVFAFFLASASTRHKKDTDILLAEYLRQHPNIHPKLFWDTYKKHLAWGDKNFPAVSPDQIMSPTLADFRKNAKKTLTIKPLLLMTLDTGYLAFLCLNSMNGVGLGFVTEVFDRAASLWGLRTLENFNCQFSMHGAEKLAGAAGKFLFVFNHKSSLDFTLGFFALSSVHINGRPVRLRYIVAKDHFKDNLIIYSLLGVGKIIEAVGMIFIERKKRERGFDNLKQAARSLVDTDVDLAIYPQGTRAQAAFDRSGKRRDAGYYTTITKKDPSSRLAHLRKGTAHLIADTLQILAAENNQTPLHIVFVGIKGTATALPTDSLKVQPETSIDYILGDMVTLSAATWNEFVRDDFSDEERKKGRQRLIDELHLMQHEHLKSCLDLNNSIAQRYLTDLKGFFRYDDNKLEIIANALYQKALEGDTVFALIERIYALPSNQWNGFLSEFSQYLQDGAGPERYQNLLKEVSEMLASKTVI